MSQLYKIHQNGYLSIDVPTITVPNSPISPTQRPSRKRTRSDASIDNSSTLSTILGAAPLGKEGSRIRILKLHGGTGLDLEANLQIHDSNTPYEALSYTWGTGKDLSTLRVVEGGDICEVPITSNLEAALRQLRYKTKGKPRMLWIDALCIYLGRSRNRCCRNLRFEPLFCEWAGFTHFSMSNRKIYASCLHNRNISIYRFSTTSLILLASYCCTACRNVSDCLF